MAILGMTLAEWERQREAERKRKAEEEAKAEKRAETAVRERWAEEAAEKEYLEAYNAHMAKKMDRIDAADEAEYNRVQSVLAQRELEQERLNAVYAARWAGIAQIEQDKAESQSNAPALFDANFDPVFGPYADALASGELTFEQLQDMQIVWNDARRAYALQGYNLQDIATNAQINPLTTDDIYNALTIGAPVERLLIDRVSHKPYGLFLSLLEQKTGNELLILDGNEREIMQFEPNYLNALMSAHPDVLELALDTYEVSFPEEVITDYSGDFIQEFLDKFKLFKSGTGNQ